MVHPVLLWLYIFVGLSSGSDYSSLSTAQEYDDLEVVVKEVLKEIPDLVGELSLADTCLLSLPEPSDCICSVEKAINDALDKITLHSLDIHSHLPSRKPYWKRTHASSNPTFVSEFVLEVLRLLRDNSLLPTFPSIKEDLQTVMKCGISEDRYKCFGKKYLVGYEPPEICTLNNEPFDCSTSIVSRESLIKRAKILIHKLRSDPTKGRDPVNRLHYSAVIPAARKVKTPKKTTSKNYFRGLPEVPDPRQIEAVVSKMFKYVPAIFPHVGEEIVYKPMHKITEGSTDDNVDGDRLHNLLLVFQNEAATLMWTLFDAMQSMMQQIEDSTDPHFRRMKRDLIGSVLSIEILMGKTFNMLQSFSNRLLKYSDNSDSVKDHLTDWFFKVTSQNDLSALSHARGGMKIMLSNVERRNDGAHYKLFITDPSVWELSFLSSDKPDCDLNMESLQYLKSQAPYNKTMLSVVACHAVKAIYEVNLLLKANYGCRITNKSIPVLLSRKSFYLEDLLGICEKIEVQPEPVSMQGRMMRTEKSGGLFVNNTSDVSDEIMTRVRTAREALYSWFSWGSDEESAPEGRGKDVTPVTEPNVNLITEPSTAVQNFTDYIKQFFTSTESDKIALEFNQHSTSSATKEDMTGFITTDLEMANEPKNKVELHDSTQSPTTTSMKQTDAINAKETDSMSFTTGMTPATEKQISTSLGTSNAEKVTITDVNKDLHASTADTSTISTTATSRPLGKSSISTEQTPFVSVTWRSTHAADPSDKGVSNENSHPDTTTSVELDLKNDDKSSVTATSASVIKDSQPETIVSHLDHDSNLHEQFTESFTVKTAILTSLSHDRKNMETSKYATTTSPPHDKNMQTSKYVTSTSPSHDMSNMHTSTNATSTPPPHDKNNMETSKYATSPSPPFTFSSSTQTKPKSTSANPPPFPLTSLAPKWSTAGKETDVTTARIPEITYPQPDPALIGGDIDVKHPIHVTEEPTVLHTVIQDNEGIEDHEISGRSKSETANATGELDFEDEQNKNETKEDLQNKSEAKNKEGSNMGTLTVVVVICGVAALVLLLALGLKYSSSRCATGHVERQGIRSNSIPMSSYQANQENKNK